MVEKHLQMTGRPAAARPAELAERWLADAYELVEHGWCRSATAEDELGRVVDPTSEDAVRWSPTGALLAVWRRSAVDEELGLRALQMANLALAAAVNEIPTAWNDAPGRRHHDVLEALLSAVSLARDPALFGAGDRSLPRDRLDRRGALSAGGFDEAA